MPVVILVGSDVSQVFNQLHLDGIGLGGTVDYFGRDRKFSQSEKADVSRITDADGLVNAIERITRGPFLPEET